MRDYNRQEEEEFIRKTNEYFFSVAEGIPESGGFEEYKESLPSWVKMYFAEGGASKNKSDFMIIDKGDYTRVLHDNHYDELVSLRDYLKQQEKRLLMAKAQVFITLVIIITHLLLLIYFKP